MEGGWGGKKTSNGSDSKSAQGMIGYRRGGRIRHQTGFSNSLGLKIASTLKLD